MDVEAVRRMLAPLVARIAGLVLGADLLNVNDDDPRVQWVQIRLLGQEREDVERRQLYGLTSFPDPSQGFAPVVGAVGGNHDHLHVLADGDRNRPSGLLAGEVLIYDRFGKRIHLKADGTLDIFAPKIVVTGDEIEIDATTSIKIGETAPLVDIQAKGNYADHLHDQVQPGAGNTGGVV